MEMINRNLMVKITKEPYIDEDGLYGGSPIFYRLYWVEQMHQNEFGEMYRHTLIGTCVLFDRNVDPVYANFGPNIISECSSAYYESVGLGSINSLHIEPEYRGQGYGLYLLSSVMYHCYHYRRLIFLEVDDVSDYSGTPNSIYYRAGFRPDSDDNHLWVDLRAAELDYTKLVNNKIV